MRLCWGESQVFYVMFTYSLAFSLCKKNKDLKIDKSKKTKEAAYKVLAFEFKPDMGSDFIFGFQQNTTLC